MNTKIGIIDWGIGGMSVYSSLRKLGHTVNVAYVADSGSDPYGKMTEEYLRGRFEILGKFLKEKNCSEVLVACNAASSAIQGETESFGGLDFHSIIPAAVRMAINSRSQRIGVIGGIRTIESGIYQNHLKDRKFLFTHAQPLSALVEAGNLTGEAVEAEISQVLDRIPGVDALLLACTHYPALNQSFSKMQPKMELIDPAEEMIKVRTFEAGKSGLDFYTTGNLEQSISSTEKAFGIRISQKQAWKI